MAKSSSVGKGRPQPVEPRGVPAAPEVGHYVITVVEFGIEQWWRIGRVLPDGSVDAAFTRGAIIRTIPGPLKFKQFSKPGGHACWVRA